MRTDTTEKGLETLIMRQQTDTGCPASSLAPPRTWLQAGSLFERPVSQLCNTLIIRNFLIEWKTSP